MAIACLVFFAMTLVKTYPLLLHIGTHIPSDPGDPLLNTWIMAWDFHALTTNPWSLFHANIFYPVENALAFSEHLIGVLPIFAPAYALTGNPVFAYNVAFFLSFALSGVAMFLLVHDWTHDAWAALVSGFLFAFAPVRFGQLPHLQLLTLYWIPFALLFLERFLRTTRWADLSGFTICYWWQALSSLYLGLYTTVMVVVYLLCGTWSINKTLFSRVIVPKYVAFVASSVLILLPFFVPYYHAHQQWGFARSLDECASGSADLFLSYLTVPRLLNEFYVRLFRFAPPAHFSNEKWLFPGLLLPLLVVVGFLPSKRFSLTDHLRRMRQVYCLLLISAFIFSLGPYLTVFGRTAHFPLPFPLPYLLLYCFVPGFQAMRVPARFGLMVFFAGSVLAAVGFLRLCAGLRCCPGLRRLSWPACEAVLAMSCLVMFAIELGVKPLPLVKIRTGQDIPAVYRWLAREQLGPLVELPNGGWENFRYMYFSTYHWLPIVNGQSGFFPPTYFEMSRELKALPSQRASEFLSAVGVKGIVVHLKRLSPHDRLRWRHMNPAETGLGKIAEFGSDVVYKIRPVESTRHLELMAVVPDHLPAGATVMLALVAKGGSHRFWTHPQPLGRTPLIIEWMAAQPDRCLRQTQRLELPLVIRPEETASLSVPIRTPSSSGRYLLRIQVPSLNIPMTPKLVELQK